MIDTAHTRLDILGLDALRGVRDPNSFSAAAVATAAVAAVARLPVK